MSCLRTTVAALVLAGGLFGTASAAQGGWVTIKNDTKKVIVVQETGGPLNRPIRGKSVKLQPGETYREYHLLSGTKNVVLYDADAPNAPLSQSKMTWEKSDAAFAVQTDGKQVTLAAVSEKKKTEEKK
jgi:hypothetical protein